MISDRRPPKLEESSAYLLVSAFVLVVLALSLAIFRAEFPKEKQVQKDINSKVNLELDAKVLRAPLINKSDEKDQP